MRWQAVLRENHIRRGIEAISGRSRMVQPCAFIALLVWILRAVFTSRGALALENIALRQQLAAYARGQKCPRLKPQDRAFWVALSTIWKDWRSPLAFVKPATEDCLAPASIPAVLAMTFRQARPAPHPRRADRLHPPDQSAASGVRGGPNRRGTGHQARREAFNQHDP